VFLRELEYYSGILFLTTNRPGTLDEAFKSRIHVSLRYPGLDLKSTKKIWSNIMKRLEVENKTAAVKVEFNRSILLNFAKNHFKKCQKEGIPWNGRQIRNAFQTALALGNSDRQRHVPKSSETPEGSARAGQKKNIKIKLTRKNFKVVARATHEFEDYIVWLRGRDSDAARDAEVRDDDYDPSLPPARKSYMNDGDGVRRRGRISSFGLPYQYHGDEDYSARTVKRKRHFQKMASDDEDEEEDENEDEDEDDEDDEDDGDDDDDDDDDDDEEEDEKQLDDEDEDQDEGKEDKDENDENGDEEEEKKRKKKRRRKE
jgi:hypothetical protein